jgi:hypothetical protein
MAYGARTTEITADDVCQLLTLLEVRRIHIWLDGGWAVDACLGSQTRRRSDLDIVIEERDVPAAVAALQDRGCTCRFNSFHVAANQPVASDHSLATNTPVHQYTDDSRTMDIVTHL